MYHEAAKFIKAAGLKPSRSLVGSYVTSLDMAGCSITVSLLDDDAARLRDSPVHMALPALGDLKKSYAKQPALRLDCGRGDTS